MRPSNATLFAAAVSLFATFTPVHALADSYGALAYSPSTGASGWSHSYSTRSAAEASALRGCAPYARDCRVAIWFVNACGAIATGPDGWGSGWGNTRTRAEYEAMQVCNRHSRGCEIMRWQCSGAK